MIYLTHYRSLSTTNAELFDDVVYPQRVHWFPEIYAKVKSGLFYVPHKIAEKVLDPELCKYLRENHVGKTAFILAGGNAHFAGDHVSDPGNVGAAAANENLVRLLSAATRGQEELQ